MFDIPAFPTFVIGASPSTDEAVAEVEHGLVDHITRKANRLDVVGELKGRAEQQQRHIVIGCENVVTIVHFHSPDGADLGVISWRR